MQGTSEFNGHQLAEFLGITPRNANAHLRRLEDKGAIVLVGRKSGGAFGGSGRKHWKAVAM